MGLGPNEQRLLGQIERALRGSDPKLAAEFATFNRRNFHEAMPLRERLLHPPSRAVRLAPIAVAAFVLSMILISVTVLSRMGPAKENPAAACGIAWVQGCQAGGVSPHAARGVVDVGR